MKFIKVVLLAMLLAGALLGGVCPSNSTHKVVAGDATWSVVKVEYQTTETATAGLVPLVATVSGIADPSKIKPGDILVLPCFGKKEAKKFTPFMTTRPQIAPTEISVNELSEMVAPEITVPEMGTVQTMFALAPIAPIAEETSAPTVTAQAEPVEAVSTPTPPQTEEVKILVEAAPAGANARVGKKNKGGNYQTVVFVPGGLVEGIREGKLPFPAVLATKKQEDGRWKNREEMKVQIQKITTEKGVGYIMTLLTKQKLIMDSALRVDFGEGYAFTFPGEYLVDKDLTQVTYVNQKLPKKLAVSYKSLNEFLPKRLGLVSKSLHFFPPLVPQLVMASMGNPVPLAFTAIGITSNKFASRQAKVPKSVQTEQQERIQMLETQVEDLSGKLNDLLAALQQNSKQVELAQNVQ